MILLIKLEKYHLTLLMHINTNIAALYQSIVSIKFARANSVRGCHSFNELAFASFNKIDYKKTELKQKKPII